MACAEINGDASIVTIVPTDVAGLRTALIAQREYTLALYADLPSRYWEPRTFPFNDLTNPPLWELAHIAWFQELFALRWRADDVRGERIPSCLNVADGLFDSSRVAHVRRWDLAYPSKSDCFTYMQRVLENTIEALEKSSLEDRYGFQLALVHEDMHAEALLMILTILGLALPDVTPKRAALSPKYRLCTEIACAGGIAAIGARTDAFSFDNEKPAHATELAPFAIDAQVVSATQFAAFVASSAYHDQCYRSVGDNDWRDRATLDSQRIADAGGAREFAALHVNYFEAEAYCRWKNRRLPTEAEWEHAAMSSDEFFASTGHVWEWTASMFVPYPGFQAERYRDYSEPWFHSHQVLKGGSFVTHPRLKYPQYRNFYTPERSDMFCGFRTCALA